MRREVRTIAQIVLDMLFPVMCIGCARSGFIVCDECSESTPLRESKPVDIDVSESIDKCYIAALYENKIIHTLIESAKYFGSKRSAKQLGFILARYLQTISLDTKGLAIMPVPLHSRRLRERGYNQSEIIADVVGEILGVCVVKDVVKRTVYTKSQVHLHKSDRYSNVSGVFVVTKKCDYDSVLLIDDVITTGATCSSIAGVLTKAGARRVMPCAVAKH
ncbi:MAG: ComF family protein [Patescibacteria group bacterium]